MLSASRIYCPSLSFPPNATLVFAFAKLCALIDPYYFALFCAQRLLKGLFMSKSFECEKEPCCCSKGKNCRPIYFHLVENWFYKSYDQVWVRFKAALNLGQCCEISRVSDRFCYVQVRASFNQIIHRLDQLYRHRYSAFILSSICATVTFSFQIPSKIVCGERSHPVTAKRPCMPCKSRFLRAIFLIDMFRRLMKFGFVNNRQLTRYRNCTFLFSSILDGNRERRPRHTCWIKSQILRPQMPEKLIDQWTCLASC